MAAAKTKHNLRSILFLETETEKKLIMIKIEDCILTSLMSMKINEIINAVDLYLEVSNFISVLGENSFVIWRPPWLGHAVEWIV